MVTEKPTPNGRELSLGNHPKPGIARKKTVTYPELRLIEAIIHEIAMQKKIDR